MHEIGSDLREISPERIRRRQVEHRENRDREENRGPFSILAFDLRFAIPFRATCDNSPIAVSYRCDSSTDNKVVRVDDDLNMLTEIRPRRVVRLRQRRYLRFCDLARAHSGARWGVPSRAGSWSREQGRSPRNTRFARPKQDASPEPAQTRILDKTTTGQIRSGDSIPFHADTGNERMRPLTF